MLYTVMPLEKVWAGSVPDPEVVVHRGRSCLAVREGHFFRLLQLLSSDPKDFLDPHLQPGTRFIVKA